VTADPDAALPETGYGAILKSLVEVSPFFFLAGMGMVASGALLEHAEKLQVFEDVPALLILVPALLGLKGNLEMTLGARLGSHANNGELGGDIFWLIVRSNLLAVQCQAIVVGTAASVLAVAENFAQTGVWDFDEALLLTASAITAASLASLVLSSLMISIVVAATKKGVDPDNISAPIAGMLGDFCTLGVVVLVAMFYWSLPRAFFRVLLAGLLAAYMVLAVFCFVAAKSSQYTREIMVWGWPPVILSMMLSNLSGPISEASIEKFSTFARFQVVMNGAGGNLGAIFCSKLSTDLLVAQNEMEREREGLISTGGPSRLTSKTLLEERRASARSGLPGPFRALSKSLPYMGHLRPVPTRALLHCEQTQPHLRVHTSWVDLRVEKEKDYLSGFASISALRGSGDMRRFGRMLLLLIVPGQALFACVVVGAASGWSATPSWLFLACFILASTAQVVVLLVAARQLVVILWRHKIDPDNCASPLVCGLGDLFGTSFMSVAFLAVSYFHGEAWPGSL
jgi:cation transporter-like permease